MAIAQCLRRTVVSSLRPLLPSYLKPLPGLRSSTCATPAAARFSDPATAAKHDATYRNPEVVAQRSALMAVLDISPGEKVLDVGCGTAFLLNEIAHAVGSNGRAEGCDPADAMIVLAADKVGSRPNVSVRQGSAHNLPYEDEMFDAVVFSQVLLYVEDVPKALLEAKRVLRSGGRVVILDTDWASLVVNTEHKERFARLQAVFERSFHDAHLPPKLPGLLRSNGLTVEDVRTIPMLAQGNVSQQGGSFMGNWAFDKIPKAGHDHGLPAVDVDGWLSEQRLLCEQEMFFACVHRFVFLSRKP